MRLAIWHLPLVLAVAGCASTKTLPSFSESHVGKVASEEASTTDIAERRYFRSALLNADVTYHVYLPASYGEDTDRSYPVVYWLHGSGGYPPGVLEMLSSRFHSAMQNGRMPPTIIVFPDGFAGTMWANAADGSMPVEDMLVTELVPHIDASFRTRPSPSGRLLEGASMGGYGAARLGLLYPHIFGAISMINPGPMQRVLDPDDAPLAGRTRAQATLDRVFGGDPVLFERQSPWTVAASFVKQVCFHTRIRMILGSSDPIAPTNLRFSRRLKELGIDHEVELVADAGHDPQAMFANLADTYWKFFDSSLTDRPDRGSECRSGPP